MVAQTGIDNPLSRFDNPVLAAVMLTLWITALIVWSGEPRWDLSIANAWFDQLACATSAARDRFCAGFPAAQNPALMFIRKTLHPAPTWIGIGLLLWVIADWRTGYRLDFAPMRARIVLVATLIVWPLLMVNGVLKAHWGRPRPWQVDEFGGWLPFVEAGTITGHCASNCSFVSGEAAGGGWLALLFLLAPLKHRFVAALIFVPLGAFMAALRVAFGAHFASDAMLGFLGSIATFAIIATILEMRAPRGAKA